MSSKQNYLKIKNKKKFSVHFDISLKTVPFFFYFIKDSLVSFIIIIIILKFLVSLVPNLTYSRLKKKSLIARALHV